MLKLVPHYGKCTSKYILKIEKELFAPRKLNLRALFWGAMRMDELQGDREAITAGGQVFINTYIRINLAFEFGWGEHGGRAFLSAY
jgi:hypothetical protein